MKRIASFEVNHDKLKPGMYTSRIDGDVTTYDIRMVYPNAGTYIQPAAGHTFEHLFATYARNSRFADHIIYCGPMGCQTGFYFLVRDLAPSDAIDLMRETMDFVAAYEGEIPGAMWDSLCSCAWSTSFPLLLLPGSSQGCLAHLHPLALTAGQHFTPSEVDLH